MTAKISPLLFLGSLLATGCAGGVFDEALIGGSDGLYDSQACVERSIRRGTSPEGLDRAPSVFGYACQGGEAASCSVLGVMYETGRGVERDLARARTLYGKACLAGNTHACDNLRDLDADPKAPADLLTREESAPR